MLFVIVSEKFSKFFKPTHTYHSLIGISIPRFCKTNHLPLLQAYFGDASRKENDWVSLGKTYVDSPEYEDSELCLLDRMTFFGSKEDATAQHILHHKCDPVSIETTTTSIRFQQRKHDFMLHPDELCLNKKLQIPVLVCHESLVVDTGDVEIDCFKHPGSNNTEILYKKLLECYSEGKCKRWPKLLDNLDLTYSDIKLYFLLLRQIKLRHHNDLEPLESLLNILEKGLMLVQKQAGENEKAGYLADFITSFLNCLPQNFDHTLFRRSNFIYRTIEPTSAQASYGLVLYKSTNDSFEDSQIKILTLANLTQTDYACDEGVEVVIMLVDESKEFLQIQDIIFHIFIVDNARMGQDKNFYSGSKIIGIEYVSFNNHDKVFKFAVFLRTNKNSDGYWSVVNAESQVMSVAYVPIEQSGFRSYGNKIKSFKYIS
ncbi:hypothetical protein QE152_g30164 [Popillia japonica]|uniref:Uncharacterized protein n=1 Tax=Popillia japonica TaxID=7064 RepID=A0AAW1JF31_POPJA